MPGFDYSGGLPPGYEFGYDQVTSQVNITSTTEASPTSCISCAAHWFDGKPVLVAFNSPQIINDTNAASDFVLINLFEGSTNLGRFGAERTVVTATPHNSPMSMFCRITPTAGYHTYTIGGWLVGGTANTPGMYGGVGGAGDYFAAFVRFTKV